MLALPKPDAKPTDAGVGHRPARPRRRRARSSPSRRSRTPSRSTRRAAPVDEPPVKERLFAHPTRANAAAAGGAQQEFLRTGRIDGALTPARALGLARDQIVIKQLKVGSQVPGRHRARPHRHARPRRKHPHVRFEIRPAGRGAPRIDPKPILDGWKLLESTAIYRAQGQEPVRRPGRRDADDRPDPADEQGDADRSACSTTRAMHDLRLRPPGHPGRRDRPPRAGHARVPRRLRLQPDGHVAELRPLVPDRVGQRLRALHRHARSTSPRSTASRSSATRARARSPSSSSSAC